MPDPDHRKIARALGLNWPHCEEEDAIAIEMAVLEMQIIEEQVEDVVLTSKQTKMNLQKLRAALLKAKVARAALPQAILNHAFHDLNLQVNIRACDAYLKLPTNRVKPKAIRQREAALQARHLLRHFGLPIRPNPTGKWCELAAILCEGTVADVYPYCLELA